MAALITAEMLDGNIRSCEDNLSFTCITRMVLQADIADIRIEK